MTGGRAKGVVVRALAVAFGGLVLASAPAAQSETKLGEAHLSGTFEGGYRFVTGDWGSGKWREYRDFSPSFFGTTALLLESQDWRNYLSFDGDYVGNDDQRYGFEVGRWGTGRLRLEYQEFPHFYSTDVRSLYALSGDDRLVLPPGLQASLQAPTGGTAAATRSRILASALSGAPRSAMEWLYRTGRAEGRYKLTDELEARVGYFIQDRDEGDRPLSMGFGTPGGTFVNFAAPIDDQTHQVTGALDWSHGPVSLSLDLLGSWYRNDLESLTVANPLRASDSAPTVAANGDVTSNPTFGRISLSPDNAALQTSLTAAWRVPTEFPMRITGTFSYGHRTQDDAFLPHTLNSRFTSALLGLPRSSLDGNVNTWLANVLVTARPTPKLGLKARYRFYDYDNTTDEFIIPANVENDTVFRTGNERTVFPEYRRQNVDLDASYTFLKPLVLHLGYGWDRWDRSNDREVRNLNEHEIRTHVDYTAARWTMLRLGYEYSARDGSDYRTYAMLARRLDDTEFATAIQTGQSPLLRKYDQADRDRHRVSLLWRITPLEELEIALNGGLARDYYEGGEFGRDEDENWDAGIDASWRPIERLLLRAGYAYEHQYVRQFSRNRGVNGGGFAIDNTFANWESHWRASIHDVTAGLDVVIWKDVLDFTLDYVFERADDRTLSSGFYPNATSNLDQAFDFPEDQTELNQLTTTLRYHVTEYLTLKAAWSWQHLDNANFRTEDLNPYMPLSNWGSTALLPPNPATTNDVFLGDRRGSYSAHVFGMSAELRF
jgi:MtrB/PioB family decaheme-associated outer membrane protein